MKKLVVVVFLLFMPCSAMVKKVPKIINFFGNFYSKKPDNSLDIVRFAVIRSIGQHYFSPDVFETLQDPVVRKRLCDFRKGTFKDYCKVVENVLEKRLHDKGIVWDKQTSLDFKNIIKDYKRCKTVQQIENLFNQDSDGN